MDGMEERVREKYRMLTKKLIEKNISITTMESATSGQIASLITDTEGASAIFPGAFVTYCNETKKMQGVSEKVIEKYSVYSKETAKEMARCCRETYGADIGIGVTGTFGNIDPKNKEASTPGCIYFAIDYRGEVKAYKRKLPLKPTRLAYKLAAAEEIVNILLKRPEI